MPAGRNAHNLNGYVLVHAFQAFPGSSLTRTPSNTPPPGKFPTKSAFPTLESLIQFGHCSLRVLHNQHPSQVFYNISLQNLGIFHPIRPLLFQSSNPVADMNDANYRPRNSTIADLLFCCFPCCVSDDERALLRPAWFQKVRRSISRADYADGDSQNWWRKGWNSVKRAGEWSESVVEDAGSCCSRPRWKHFVRRFKADGKTICSSKPSRFKYDPLSYELNFDHGSRQDEDHQRKGLSLSPVNSGESAGAL